MVLESREGYRAGRLGRCCIEGTNNIWSQPREKAAATGTQKRGASKKTNKISFSPQLQFPACGGLHQGHALLMSGISIGCRGAWPSGTAEDKHTHTHTHKPIDLRSREHYVDDPPGRCRRWLTEYRNSGNWQGIRAILTSHNACKLGLVAVLIGGRNGHGYMFLLAAGRIALVSRQRRVISHSL